MVRAPAATTAPPGDGLSHAHGSHSRAFNDTSPRAPVAGMRTIVFAHRAFRRYRVKTTVSDLTLAPPAPDAVAVWLTQWLLPATPAAHRPRALVPKRRQEPFVAATAFPYADLVRRALRRLGPPEAAQIAERVTEGAVLWVCAAEPVARVGRDPVARGVAGEAAAADLDGFEQADAIAEIEGYRGDRSRLPPVSGSDVCHGPGRRSIARIAEPRAGPAHLDAPNFLGVFAAGRVGVGVALAELALGVAGRGANGSLGAGQRREQLGRNIGELVARRVRTPRRGREH